MPDEAIIPAIQIQLRTSEMHLRGNFAGNLGIAMANRDGEDAAEKVEVLVAVKIPEVLHLATIGDQQLLEVVGHRAPKAFPVPGDGFVAACAAAQFPCWKGLRGSGHEGILA